jgi:hypothetical protein
MFLKTTLGSIPIYFAAFAICMHEADLKDRGRVRYLMGVMRVAVPMTMPVMPVTMMMIKEIREW